MKCIKLIPRTRSEAQPGHPNSIIWRTDDYEAALLVGANTHQYMPKSAWKLQERGQVSG